MVSRQLQDTPGTCQDAPKALKRPQDAAMTSRLAVFRTVLGDLGAILAALRRFLGRSLRCLRHSWDVLGGDWGGLGLLFDQKCSPLPVLAGDSLNDCVVIYMP